MRKIYLIMLPVSAILVFILPIFTSHDTYYYSLTAASYGTEIFIWDMIIISGLQVSKYNKIPKTDATKSIQRRRIMWIVVLIFFALLAFGQFANALRIFTAFR